MRPSLQKPARILPGIFFADIGVGTTVRVPVNLQTP